MRRGNTFDHTTFKVFGRSCPWPELSLAEAVLGRSHPWPKPSLAEAVLGRSRLAEGGWPKTSRPKPSLPETVLGRSRPWPKPSGRRWLAEESWPKTSLAEDGFGRSWPWPKPALDEPVWPKTALAEAVLDIPDPCLRQQVSSSTEHPPTLACVNKLRTPKHIPVPCFCQTVLYMVLKRRMRHPGPLPTRPFPTLPRHLTPQHRNLPGPCAQPIAPKPNNLMCDRLLGFEQVLNPITRV